MSIFRKQTELDGTVRHELLGYVCADDRYVGNIHSHPFTETLYAAQGELDVHCNKKSVHLKKGDAVILRPASLHHITVDDSGVLLYIGCSYIRLGIAVPFPEDEMTVVKDESVLKKLETLAQLYISDSGADASELLMPLDIFWRNLAENSNAEHDGDILIERIKEYLQTHPFEQLSVADLAEKFYISAHYLGNKFCKHTGQTIKQYHNKYRMEYAMSLIENSPLTLSQIAEKLGYNTLQYFSVCFKKHFGIAPVNIRRK